jgi:hypothetical protein
LREGSWKWISGFLLAALILWGIGHWLASPRERPPTPKITKTAGPPIPGAAPGIATTAASAGARPAHTGEIEICGVGRIKSDPDDPEAVHYVTALTEETRVRWIAALRNSDDNRARAVGLYVENILNRDFTEITQEDAQNELVQLAVGTVDPAVYALAYFKCNPGFDGRSPGGACASLSPQEWAQRDPDNAAPWLVAAANARRENNSAAEADAFAHLAKAQKYDPYNFSLLQFAETETPRDATPLDRLAFAIQMIGVEAATSPPWSPVSRHCSAEALQDPAVHQQCEALAEFLAAKVETQIDLSFAISLGKRVGWPDDRVNAMRLRLTAGMGALQQAVPEGHGEEWSCEGVERGNAFLADWARLGELGAVQELVERSGETPAELARKHQEFLDEMRRSAQPPIP